MDKFVLPRNAFANVQTANWSQDPCQLSSSRACNCVAVAPYTCDAVASSSTGCQLDDYYICEILQMMSTVIHRTRPPGSLLSS
mmetsp:Transcript_8838/g.16898  ORF Transcript_8838/g.16898 Transcript_8838/m.16898 type:complete len:83 (-) Transcript_8838:91-339(-)